jgi:virginiamycin B lyase
MRDSMDGSRRGNAASSDISQSITRDGIGVTSTSYPRRAAQARTAAASACVAAVVGLLTWPGIAAAQTTQFTVPSADSDPTGIIAGPDGALWFTEQSANKIGRVTTSGSFTEFTVPTAVALPLSIIVGPDGALWFTELGGVSKIGRITTAGAITEFPLPAANAHPEEIVLGPDNAFWFGESNTSKIGRITLTGSVTEFATPTANSFPDGIAVGTDGNLWFAERTGNKIGRITTSGAITEFAVPIATSEPRKITSGPDGALWFTQQTGAIGRITTAGAITEFPLSTPNASPADIVAAPDGTLWFGQANTNIGQITTAGAITETTLPQPSSSGTFGVAVGPDGALWFTGVNGNTVGRIGLSVQTSPLVAAVLPASRSVEVGNTATAFATIINSGNSAASLCTIAAVTQLPATFLYQTTNPQTNALTGSPNTPANIAAGASQSFVIAFTPSAAFSPTNTVLGFDCSNIPGAPSVAGINTLELSASATPVPDIVALAASGDPGFVDIPGATGSGAFAVATVNLGSDATITVGANTGTANLSVTLAVCQTNPQSGACLAAPAPSATTDIQPNATPTFGIFVTGSAAVANSPGVNRVFVTFTDSGGTLRGETSVAVRTQ